METFSKFKDWLLNVIGIVIIGGLVSIKNDLSDIKADIQLTKYRLQLLEAKAEKNEKKDSEQDNDIASIKAILPEKTRIKRNKYNYNEE